MVNRYLDQKPASTREEAGMFIEKINKGIKNNEWIFWAICRKDSGELAGTICIWNIQADHSRAETGYMLHPDFQGKGVMREAIVPVLKYAFEEMNLMRLEAWTHQDNLRSSHLLGKLGFERDPLAEQRKDPESDNPMTIVYTLSMGKYAAGK